MNRQAIAKELLAVAIDTITFSPRETVSKLLGWITDRGQKYFDEMEQS